MDRFLVPESVFWTNGFLKIVYHFEGCFSLFVNGFLEVGPCSFDVVVNYIWAEWPPF